MNRNTILTFVMGSVIGALGMKWYMEHKHNEFLEQEAQWCEDMANRVAHETTDGYESDIEKAYRLVDARNNELEQERKVLVMNKDRYEKVARNYNKTIDAVETPAIEVISFETFCERYNNNDKITLMFHYEGELGCLSKLVDEDGDVIQNPMEVVGDVFNSFGHLSGDPEVVYVRNNRLGVDYEIVRTGEPYEPKEGDER